MSWPKRKTPINANCMISETGLNIVPQPSGMYKKTNETHAMPFLSSVSRYLKTLNSETKLILLYLLDMGKIAKVFRTKQLTILINLTYVHPVLCLEIRPGDKETS